MTSTDANAKNKRLIIKLAVLVIGMFGFGFALVPLYSVVCKVTGLNGKTETIDAATAKAMKVDKSRWVTVEFTTNVNAGMPWEFKPMVNQMKVHPGELVTANFYARNPTSEAMVGQAVPSITPRVAALYFKKLECFCFSQQTLKAKEGKEMPVQYVVEPGLPADVHTITLSYTFFNVNAGSAAAQPAPDRDVLAGDHAHSKGATSGG